MRTRASLSPADVDYVLFWTLLYRMVSVVIVMVTIPMRPALPAWMAEAFQLFSYPLCAYSLALLIFRKKVAVHLHDRPYCLLIDLFIALGILQLGGSWRSSYFAYTVTTIMIFTAFEGKRGAYISALALTAAAIIKDPAGGLPSYDIFYITDWDMRVGAAFFYLGTGLIFGYFHSLLMRLESLSREKIEETRKLAGMEEKNRMALELHDGAKQMVNAMLLKMTPAIKRIQHSRDETADELRWLWKGMNYLKNEFNQVLNMLSGENVETGSSCDVLLLVEEEAKIAETMTGFSWRVTADIPEMDMPRRSQLPLRRFLSEALMNAWKHSGTRSGSITVRSSGPGEPVVIIVADSGKGFNLDNAAQGMTTGLKSLKHRAKELFGDVVIETAPGKGCNLTLAFPHTTGSGHSNKLPERP